MCTLKVKTLFLVMEWTIFLSLTAIAIGITWEVFLKYDSLDSTFKRKEIPITQIPTFSMCLDPPHGNFSYEKDFHIERYFSYQDYLNHNGKKLALTNEFFRNVAVSVTEITTVYKGKRFLENNTLDIKSFIKPTNSFQYLHRQSAHSPSVFKGFIQGECIRHLRNTNDETIYKNLTAGFKSHLLRRGYSHSEIDPIIQKTHLTQRNTVLQKTNKKTKNSVPLVMVTKYNPCVKNLKKRILKYWDKMTDDSACKEIFKEEPIISYSKHKNISDLIIRSRLPPSDNDT